MEGEGGRERGIRKEKLYLVLVSDKSPVMESRAVLRSTPLVSPMFRNRPPTVPRPPSPPSPHPPSPPDTVTQEGQVRPAYSVAAGCPGQ